MEVINNISKVTTYSRLASERVWPIHFWPLNFNIFISFLFFFFFILNTQCEDLVYKLMLRKCLNKHCEYESLFTDVTLNLTLFSQPAVTFGGGIIKTLSRGNLFLEILMLH